MRPVSPSDVKPFEQCPALWHATRVRRLDSGNRFMRIGAALHVACNALTRAVLGEDGRALYLVARDAVTAHADDVDMDPGEMHEALDVMDAATAKDSAISWWVPEGWTAIGAHELRVDHDFASVHVWDGDDPTCYRSRLDRLQWNDASGELEVWDWSGSLDYISKEELLLDVRVRWDSMLALAWFPAAHVVTFRRVMLRLGYTQSVKFVRAERWHGQIMDRARRLRAAIGAIARREDFVCKVCGNMPDTSGEREHGRGCYTLDPDGGGTDYVDEVEIKERHGRWCRACPVRERCLTYAAARNTGAEPDPTESRESRARRLGALKAAEDELDEDLREDVRANGPIPLGDGTALGFWPHRGSVLRGTRDETIAEIRRLGMTDAQERERFREADRATPGIVRVALAELQPNRGLRQATEERLLATSTGFNFETKETEDA